MRQIGRPFLFLFLALLGACSRDTQTVHTEAQGTAAVLSGDAKGAAADNPRCRLFTTAEVANYLGEAVAAGRNAAMGAGCQWQARDGGGHVIVSIAPSNYHAPPSAVEGFKELTDVGTRGYVAPESTGWTAGAITGSSTVVVTVEGTAATEANTVALLKAAMQRHAS
jgi:hypothetical protein